VNAVAARRGLPAAWWGMAMVVAAEGTLFAMLIGTYLYLRVKNVQWPPQGIPEPKVALPLAMLAVLVLTSVPMQLAYVAGRRVELSRARALLALALLAQIAYLVVSLRSYAHDLDTFTPQQHAYGSIYYTLLGGDHAHVLVGILLNLWLLAKLARGLTRYRLNALLAIAFYWHAVNALTVVVTLTILSPAL
jgi:heme/copper-type cytochrome/quinol oxidase subunit 3